MGRAVPVLVAIATVAGPGVVPAGAVTPPPVSVPHVLRHVLPRVRARSGLRVLLPGRVAFGVRESRMQATGGAKRGSYDLELGAAPHCNGANACFLASFTARRARRLGERANVDLAHGLRGHFRDLSCGAPCSPPSISWLEHGVRYAIQLNLAGHGSLRSQMVRVANAAIRAGTR